MKYLGAILSLLLTTSAFAAGVPRMDPLQYAGTLYQNNQPYTGQADITLSLYTDRGGANEACSPVQQPGTNVQNGAFRFPLSPACVAAVRDNFQLYLRLSVTIAGSTVLLPIEKLAASPYTMVADRATSAEPSSVLDQRIEALEAPNRQTRAIPVDLGTQVFQGQTQVLLTRRVMLTGNDVNCHVIGVEFPSLPLQPNLLLMSGPELPDAQPHIWRVQGSYFIRIAVWNQSTQATGTQNIVVNALLSCPN